ncbi:exosortase/archaeosortase family protein [Mucisphaera calidilacus]|uniref:Transmembrane exosortase (Exosortase_EpsH) n=1 Tax=Mucisphaera calidilacus TaxID=2527982 RepID=A0A518BTF3_9BACT|nr:exosortase/archaeosortase family protein [Mucisphaera calidilacus]QDU70256.1 Transmembrane exosortase (Exosortase_EpsH) [Mucisphaera calidilacus]
MTTASLNNPVSPKQPGSLFTPSAWGLMAVLIALFGLLHYVFLRRTWLFATTDSDWSHALIVPLISLYYIRIHQDHIRQTIPRVAPIGLLFMLAGFVGYGLGIYPIRNDMAQGYSMILALFGITWFVMGTHAMRWLWFPVAYLVFAVKVSDKIWEQIANLLQAIAANAATIVLECWAVFDGNLESVNDRGITIDLTFYKAGELITESINVAEACSGLRMLMAFIALGVAFAFIQKLQWWQRIALISLTIPIAILVNVARVSTIGVLYVYNREMATGDFHIFVGMLMLIPAAGIFMLVTWILDNIVISDEDEDETPPARKTDAQADETPEPPAWVSPTRVLSALVTGAGVTLLAGLAYLGFLSALRPDVVGESFPAWAGWTTLVVCTLALLIAIVAVVPALFRNLPEGPTGRPARQMALIVIIGALATATAGLKQAVAMTEVVLLKEAVPLRESVVKIPFTMGPWRLIDDQRLPKDIVSELGTEQYVSRLYVNTQMHDATGVDFKNTTQRNRYLADAPVGSMVRLHVAYYTGTADTVPHVPERCFIAGGLVARGGGYPLVTLDRSRLTRDIENSDYLATLPDGQTARIPDAEFTMRQFTYGTEDRPDQDMHVLYVFAANGEFAETAERVRLLAFNPTDRYSYYCKIELQPIGVADPNRAVETVTRALDDMLPHVMAALPDWIEVTEGTWPPAEPR